MSAKPLQRARARGVSINPREPSGAPLEAVAILHAITGHDHVVSADVLGFSRRGDVFLLLRLPERVFTALCTWDAGTEDAEDHGDDEPDGEGEPSLGSLGGCMAGAEGDQRIWPGGNTDDCERETVDRDTCDDEPSLASVNAIDQTHWCAGGRQDRELDRADEEPSHRDHEKVLSA
jgi:hypothetical protein